MHSVQKILVCVAYKLMSATEGRQAWEERMAPFFSGIASPVDCGLVKDDPILYRARVAPDRPALFEIATGRQLTYAALDARVARCAGFLVPSSTYNFPPSIVVCIGGCKSIDPSIDASSGLSMPSQSPHC